MVKTGQFAHSNRIDYGENSYHKEPSDPTKDNGNFFFKINIFKN
jgi:hypothetical protein